MSPQMAWPADRSQSHPRITLPLSHPGSTLASIQDVLTLSFCYTRGSVDNWIRFTCSEASSTHCSKYDAQIHSHKRAFAQHIHLDAPSNSRRRGSRTTFGQDMRARFSDRTARRFVWVHLPSNQSWVRQVFNILQVKERKICRSSSVWRTGRLVTRVAVTHNIMHALSSRHVTTYRRKYRRSLGLQDLCRRDFGLH